MSDRAFHPIVQYGLIVLGALAVIWLGTLEIHRRHHQKVRAGEVQDLRSEDILFLTSVIGTNEKIVSRSMDRRLEQPPSPIRVARGRIEVPTEFAEEGPSLISERNRQEMRAMFGRDPQ